MGGKGSMVEMRDRDQQVERSVSMNSEPKSCAFVVSVVWRGLHVQDLWLGLEGVWMAHPSLRPSTRSAKYDWLSCFLYFSSLTCSSQSHSYSICLDRVMPV